VEAQMTEIEGLVNKDFTAVKPTDAGYANLLLDQYRIAVEMADKISERRSHSNNFYLGINSAGIAVIGYLLEGKAVDLPKSFYVAVAVAGLLVTLLWLSQIRSYRDLNTAKFKVIHEIEAHLPLRPYFYEWELVKHGKVSTLYKPLSHIEVLVPLVFIMLHVLFIFLLTSWKAILCFFTGTSL
jgi:hypothetical protein